VKEDRGKPRYTAVAKVETGGDWEKDSNVNKGVLQR